MKKMLFILCAMLGVALPPIGWGKDTPRQAMKDGTHFYEAKSYDRAAQSFDAAAQSAHQQNLDAAPARYNEANALFKMGQFGAAATNYMDSARSPDLALQSRAYYNRGNALSAESAGNEKNGGLDTASHSIDEALEMYENAMTLAPADEDTKVNYELALKKKQELQKKQQEQQQQQKQNQDKKDQQQKDQSQQQDQQKKDEQQKQDQAKNQQQNQKQDQQKQNGQPESQKQAADQQKQAADQQKQPQAQKSEEMTPEEAKMMLDAMKQEEQASRDRMRLVIGQPTPVDKDW